MKRVALILCGLAMSAIGGVAVGDISGTPHDFRGESWNAGNEICQPCHTPHHSNPYNQTGPTGPLWNHQLTVATYDLYDGTQLPYDDALDLDSRLCMSCHDGTVALDSFGGAAGTTFMTGNDPNLIGTNLMNDHPVGRVATWPAHGPFNPPEALPVIWSDPTRSWNKIRLFPIINDGSIEVIGCMSCHEVHGSLGNDNLLRASNAESGLCRICHSI